MYERQAIERVKRIKTKGGVRQKSKLEGFERQVLERTLRGRPRRGVRKA